MRTSAVLLASSLAGLSVAMPSPQDYADSIDLDSVVTQLVPLVGAPLAASSTSGSDVAAVAAQAAAAASDPVVTDAATTSKVKRDGNCAAQPLGKGPVTSPDDIQDFLANPVYPQIANAAATPQGYALAFAALQGSVQGPSGSYLGFKNLNSYDTIKCQEYCDAIDPASNNGVGCTSFNIYMERDPTLDPGANCPNPASTTNYKCALYNIPLTGDLATNTGQGRNQFVIGVAGSNGYNKLAPPPAQSGFTGPGELGGAINAPDSSYIGYKFYAGGFNPSQCGAACQATTAYNAKHPRKDGTYDTCSFFVAYLLSQNNVPQGTYCSQYTKGWGRPYDKNVGQYRGSDYWSVSNAYGYNLTVSASR